MIYENAKKFIKNYPGTIGFRLKAHAKIIEKHLNPDEKVLYTFVGQKNFRSIALPNTYMIVLTNKRLLLGRKRLVFGYFFYSVTPDLYNDLKANANLIWGRIIIDTVKELIIISNVSKKALNEIETQITEFMIKEKQKYINLKDSK